MKTVSNPMRLTIAALAVAVLPVLAVAAPPADAPVAPMAQRAPMPPMPPMPPMADGEMGGMHDMMHGPGSLMHRIHQLDLTEAQQDAAFALMHGNAESMYKQHKQMKRARAALRDMAKGDAFDAAEARAAADDMARAAADMAYLRAEMGAKFRALLTPEQKKKLDAMGDGPMHGGPMHIRREVREFRQR